MRNIKLLVAYEGTAYHGFQWQTGLDTIQARFESAIAVLTKENLRIAAAGRTDTGVHATGQVVSFRTASSLPLRKLQRGLNALLPDDIGVLSAEEVDESFHARFSATSRQYVYTIATGPAKPVLDRRIVHHISQDLDVAAMQMACNLLVGEQDFASFTSGIERGASTRRHMLSVECVAAGQIIRIVLHADSFLPHMVRGIVGTLVKVGTGAFQIEDFERILRARDRTQAGPNAPAQGLCLSRVYYP